MGAYRIVSATCLVYLKGEKANRPTRPSAQRVADRPPQEIRKRRTTERRPNGKSNKNQSRVSADFAASLSSSILYLSRRVKKPRRLRSRPKRKKSSDAASRTSKDFSAFVKIGKVDRLRRFRRQSSGLRSSLKSTVFVNFLSRFRPARRREVSSLQAANFSSFFKLFKRRYFSAFNAFSKRRPISRANHCRASSLRKILSSFLTSAPQ